MNKPVSIEQEEVYDSVIVEQPEIQILSEIPVNKSRSLYDTTQIPANYVCGNCGSKGCKLWREFSVFLNHLTLRCVDCAILDQKESSLLKELTEIIVHEDGRREDRHGGMTDQIGWLVPAVPDEECKTYWGYTSVPDRGCQWWINLPLRIE